MRNHGNSARYLLGNEPGRHQTTSSQVFHGAITQLDLTFHLVHGQFCKKQETP